MRYDSLKAWQNAFEQQNRNLFAPRAKIPDVSSLPRDMWVAINGANLGDGDAGMETVTQWARDHHMKFQLCDVMLNGHHRVVFLFKKKSNVVLFKLRWG